MNKIVLDFVNKLEGYKTAIKQLHWDAKNMSQHELCDDIASSIADFQDTVSEVEQSITGNLKVNSLKPTAYKIKDLKSFVQDVLDSTNTFYKKVKGMGDTYVGMASDCESFLSDMQRKLYLVNFTIKEELKRRLKAEISEGYKKEENIKTTFHGTKPSTEKGLFKRINDLTKNGQLNTRTFGSVGDVIDFYRKILGNAGTLRCIDACEEDNYVVKLETEGGRSYYGIMRTKDVGDGQLKASITFSPHSNDNDNADVDPEYNEPVIEDGNDWEEEHLDKARKGLRKRDEENFYQRHPDFRPTGGKVEEIRLRERIEGDLDDPLYIAPYSSSNFDFNNDKKKEIEHSWRRFDKKPISRGANDFLYTVDKDSIPYDSDNAMRNRYGEKYFTDYDNQKGREFMNNWVNGKKDLPMENRRIEYKLTESELKQLVSEAVNTLLEDLSVPEREKRMEKQMAWHDFEHQPEDRKKLSDLIDLGAKGEAHARDLHSEDPELWKFATKVKESKININPENKGKFNATKKATGKSTEELKHSKNPLTRKRATFAANAKKWNHKGNKKD